MVCSTGGLNVPADKWKQIMDDANARVTKLESLYEDECIHKKVRTQTESYEYNSAAKHFTTLITPGGPLLPLTVFATCTQQTSTF